ncbi:MAG: hypothetical protein PHX78_09585 [bacterium]|nr:hypothetical protein [bacterium]
MINVGAQFIAPCQSVIKQQGGKNQGVMNHAPTIGEIVRSFKARCTRAINKIHNNIDIPVWQRNYYEHIIRNEIELNSIREYIVNNPLKWPDDENNPDNIMKYYPVLVVKYIKIFNITCRKNNRN